MAVMDLKPGMRLTLPEGGEVEVTDRPWLIRTNGGDYVFLCAFALTATETHEAGDLFAIAIDPNAEVIVK